MQEVSGLYTSLFLKKDQVKMVVLRARKVSEAFEKRVPGPYIQFECILYSCSKTILFCFV